MSLLTFDSLEFIKKLKSVGFTKEHFDVRMREFDVQMRELEYRLTIKLGGMMMGTIVIVCNTGKVTIG